MTKVLLTGGSGFIAAHILEQLLTRGHTVLTTVRSEEKAQPIRDAHASSVGQQRLHVVLVPDIAEPGAFDAVVSSPAAQGLEVVLHTASPFHFRFTDAKAELVDPALNGTRAILAAVKRSAPSVRRVVLTSSFAAIVDEKHLSDPSHVFSEASWNPVGLADIHRSPATAYRVSKTLAERAAWDFVERERPAFDLVTINPPLVLGPVAQHLPSLDAINTSNERFVALLRGRWKAAIPDSPVFISVDVRDVARAHIRAFERPGAGGRRLFTVAGSMCNRDAARVVRERFPEYADTVPGPDVQGGELPAADKTFRCDTEETDRILGIDWIATDQTIYDTVVSLKAHGI